MALASETPDVLLRAVRALCDGANEEARAALTTLNLVEIRDARRRAQHDVWGPNGIASKTPRPPSRQREPVPKARKLEAFRRDRFVCRYTHCRRRTISLPILKALSRAFPDLLPYHSNWKPLDAHLLYWVFSASIEHHVGFLHGGDSSAENLVTACYGCNDLKNWLPAEALGWLLGPPMETEWDGLESFTMALRNRGLITSRDL